MYLSSYHDIEFIRFIQKAFGAFFLLAIFGGSVQADQHFISTENNTKPDKQTVVCTQDLNSGLLKCETHDEPDNRLHTNKTPSQKNNPDRISMANTPPKIVPKLNEKSDQVKRIQYPTEICRRDLIGLSQASVCVSSILAPQSGNRYQADNLFDNRRNTAWVEGVSGNGIGEYLSIEFDTPQTVRHLELINGYTKSNPTFMKNSRINELIITASNGKTLKVKLKDVQRWQQIPMEGFEQVEWIQLRIGSAYPGTKYEDTALTELRLR